MMEIKKILKIGYEVSVGILLLIAVFVAIPLFPTIGNYKIKIVISGSMEPTIHTGSIVVVKPEKKYLPGEIITFGKDAKKDIPVTHRIVEMRAQEGKYVYRTKGDANSTEDMKEISENIIIGKVLFSVPLLGFIFDFVKKPIGFILLVILPSMIVILGEVEKISKEIRSKKKKEI